MTEVDVFVWHDLSGNITAVGHVVAGSGDQVVEPVATGDRQVLTVRLLPDHLPTLHSTHIVDMERRCLVNRLCDEPEPSR
jgi:hypothetical protein